MNPTAPNPRKISTYLPWQDPMNYRISSIKQRNPSLLTPGTNVVWIFTHAKISHQNLWASPCCFPESNHRQTPRRGISSTGGGPTHTFPKKTPWTSALCLVSTPAFQNIKTQTPKLGSSTKKQLEGKKIIDFRSWEPSNLAGLRVHFKNDSQNSRPRTCLAEKIW